MEIRSSKLFKRQVADLVCYLKVTFGKRIAFRVKNEIEEKVFLLKLFPNMGTVESLLEEEPLVYRYLVIKHNKILYTVEENYVFIHLLWDCRRDPIHLMDLIKEVD
ncbi:type II toxin-antitoxin system RelE/ParE family toxin [Parabacteroides massiliensis]|jgi:plasmid stabilization system protein ParE|uniref:type II toxin-antitoxin system RelE/ParE family toxin n=1 Tax=Parabacteroides massiliensis TaxID=1750560 RepID=UPI00096A5CED|nr:type II toxin-antitoxin system RelE/ParE family toxin [uncultured Parabacteroides sp.]